MDEKYGRAKNGGGKIYGFAEVCPETTLDKKSAIYDDVEIYNSTIKNSIIRGKVVIMNAHIENCLIEDDSIISGCYLYDSEISHYTHIAGECIIHHCVLKGCTRIFGLAKVNNCLIHSASIYGDAEMREQDYNCNDLWFINGFHRIGTGIWTEQMPRYHRFQDLEISLTESTDGHAYIGCERKPMTDWIKKGDLLGKRHGWTREHVDQAKEIFTRWLEDPKN